MQRLNSIVFKIFPIVFLCLSDILAEEECLGDSGIKCFECQSWVDPKCNDPFNLSVFPMDLPHHEECKGCCVKILTDIGTDHPKIRRTCTERLQINLFMVDHVCMNQGDGKGKMCFCERDFCNGANYMNTVFSIYLLTSLSAFVTWYTTSDL